MILQLHDALSQADGIVGQFMCWKNGSITDDMVDLKCMIMEYVTQNSSGVNNGNFKSYVYKSTANTSIVAGNITGSTNASLFFV